MTDEELKTLVQAYRDNLVLNISVVPTVAISLKDLIRLIQLVQEGTIS